MTSPSTTPPEVWIEQSPLDVRHGDYDQNDWTTWADRVAGLPAEWLAVLEPLTEVDQASCADCARPVGYVLDDDDESMRRGVHWNTLILVQTGTGPIRALCEDCIEPED